MWNKKKKPINFWIQINFALELTLESHVTIIFQKMVDLVKMFTFNIIHQIEDTFVQFQNLEWLWTKNERKSENCTRKIFMGKILEG